MKLILRRLGRQKLHTALHLVGLTLGIGVCLLIALFLRYELSFDAYHAKADRTYRINQVWTEPNGQNRHYATPLPLAEAMRTDIPELEYISHAAPQDDAIIELNPQKRFELEKVLAVDPDFLNIFEVEVIDGDVFNALRRPNMALLTESTARRFYGGEDALGKTFTYEDNYTITVGGVIRDLPGHTHLPANMLLSYATLDDHLSYGNMDSWGMVSGSSTFVVLPEGTTPAQLNLEARLKAIVDRNLNGTGNLPKDIRLDFVPQALRDVHFDASWQGGGAWVQAINPTWLWFFGAIGLAVLALAGINFVNLSTAQALNRAKEVGIRKTIGAKRGQLIGQFLGEAWLLTAGAGVSAVILAQAGLPAINNLLDKHITFNLLNSPLLLLSLLVGLFLTGLFAGLYPAWVIARFQPVASLHGDSTGGRSSAFLRKALVVTQFTISISLLIGLVLLSQQMAFFRHKNLGFNKDNVITIDVPEPGKRKLLRNQLLAVPQIKEISFATNAPIAQRHWGTVMSLTDHDGPDRQDVTVIMADENYAPLYDLHLRAGRLLEAADTNATASSVPMDQQIPKVIVNESLVKALGFASNEAALQQRFSIGFNGWKPEIVGVVADFNAFSLHEAIKPALIFPFSNVYRSVGIKIEAGSDLPATLAAIETAWKATFPRGFYEYNFLDQTIAAFYESEGRLYTLFKVFAGLAMLISCLGLWGLATFAAQQRTKEVGIRKVLGASVQGIVALLSKDFLALVLIAIAIASPLAYYGAQRWLQDFAYRIDIAWWVFALAGLIAIAIAFLTISFQSVRAALANPVKALKTE